MENLGSNAMEVPLLSEHIRQCVYSVKWYLNDKFSFLFFVFLSTLSSIVFGNNDIIQCLLVHK